MNNTIKTLSKALTKIIKSFPENSYYQLIGFGSDYKLYHNKPVKNTEENVEKSFEIINSLEADLGGTDLSKPLDFILNESYLDYKNINLSKQIIVLTDGDINIGKNIVELIKLHNNEFKIHTIGIGYNINEELLIQTSIAGNGTYHFISNIFAGLDDKVFEILNECTKEYINNYQFILEQKDFELQPIKKVLYNKESLNYCFIKKGNNIDNINMLFKWENLEEKFEKKLEFNSEEIIKLSDGDLLSKLIIGLTLRYDFNDNKNEKIKLSKLYQILCDDTTLFAEIEGEKSIKNNTITTYYNNNKNYISRLSDVDFLKRSESFSPTKKLCPQEMLIANHNSLRKALLKEKLKILNEEIRENTRNLCESNYNGMCYDMIEDNNDKNKNKILVISLLIIIIFIICCFIRKYNIL